MCSHWLQTHVIIAKLIGQNLVKYTGKTIIRCLSGDWELEMSNTLEVSRNRTLQINI